MTDAGAAELLFGDGIFKDAGIGFILGFITGWAAKKLAKLIAFFVGLGLIALKWLEEKGVLIVNWNALRGEDGVAGEAQHTATTAFESFIETIPMGAGFAAGAAVGLRRG